MRDLIPVPSVCITDLLATHIQFWVLTYITWIPMWIFIINLSLKFPNAFTRNEIFNWRKNKICKPSEFLRKISRPINIYQIILRFIKTKNTFEWGMNERFETNAEDLENSFQLILINLSVAFAIINFMRQTLINDFWGLRKIMSCAFPLK